VADSGGLKVRSMPLDDLSQLITEKYEKAFDPLFGSYLASMVVNHTLQSSLNSSIFGKVVNLYVKTILSTI